MAAAPQNLMNAGHFYTNLARPIDLNMNFIVDSANGNGLGIRSLKSNGYVKNVFMHTTAVLAGSGNPNPAAGVIVVQLAGNFNRYIGGFTGIQVPVTSPTQTSTTAGNPYIITSIGTTTLAQFQAAGLKPGFIPAVGTSFIATATGAIGGTGTVASPGTNSSITFSIIGDPNQTLGNSNSAANGGAQILIQLSGTPADNDVIALTVRLDGSSVNVDGL